MGNRPLDKIVTGLPDIELSAGQNRHVAVSTLSILVIKVRTEIMKFSFFALRIDMELALLWGLNISAGAIARQRGYLAPNMRLAKRPAM